MNEWMLTFSELILKIRAILWKFFFLLLQSSDGFCQCIDLKCNWLHLSFRESLWHDICLGNVNEGRTQTQGRYAYTIEVEWALNRSTLPIPRRPQMLWIAFAADLACGKVSARADWIFCPFGSCCQENRGIGMLRANVQSSETHFVANSQPPPPTKQKKVQFGLLNVSLNQNGNCIYSDV